LEASKAIENDKQ